jgi:iron complex outermembrane receptor protein
MKLLLLATAACVAAGAVSPAAAQIAANAANQAAVGTLSEVVITAERRTQSIQKSSLAIQVLSAQALADAGVTQVRDLTSITPGVNIGQGGPATQIYVRGVGDFGSTPTFNPAVATYIDGVYVARANAIEGNLYDLSRVEVLKGPQGTLYGRNAAGGALNILTNQAQLGRTNGGLNVEIGNYNAVIADGFLNVAVTDELAVRGAFQVSKHDGYSSMGFDDDNKQAFRGNVIWKPNEDVTLKIGAAYTHVGGIGPGYNFTPIIDSRLRTQLESLGIKAPTSSRLSITDPRAAQVILGVDALAAFLQPPFNTMLSSGSNPASVIGGANPPGTPYCLPAGVFDNARVNGVVTPITHTTSGYCNVVASRVGVVNPNYYAAIDPNQWQKAAHQDNKYWNINAELTWNFDFATLTVIPAYREVSNDYATFPVSVYDNGGRSPETSISKSLEVRLANDTKLLDWTVGGYLFQERQHQYTGQFVGENVGMQQSQSYLNNRFVTSNGAVFAQGTWHLGETLRLITGVRYSKETKIADGVQYLVYPNTAFGSPARLDCQFSNGDCLQDRFAGKVKFKSTNWKLGFEYDLAPASMIFGTVSTGFKAGGLNSISAPLSGFNLVTTGPGLTNGVGVPLPYNPEKLTAFEIGSRNRFLENRLQVNLEGFYWKYKDHQENVSAVVATAAGNRTVGSLQNVGDATMYGADVDIVWQATSADTLRFNAEYLHTKYKRFNFILSNVVSGLTIGCPTTPGPLAGTFNVDCTGQVLTRSPKWTGSTSYNHRFDLSSGATVNAAVTGQFATSSYLMPFYLPQDVAPGYFTVAANVTYVAPDGNWSVQAFGRNLTNENVFTGAFQTPGFHPNMLVRNIGAPRTYGIRAMAKF